MDEGNGTFGEYVTDLKRQQIQEQQRAREVVRLSTAAKAIAKRERQQEARDFLGRLQILADEVGDREHTVYLGEVEPCSYRSNRFLVDKNTVFVDHEPDRLETRTTRVRRWDYIPGYAVSFHAQTMSTGGGTAASANSGGGGGIRTVGYDISYFRPVLVYDQIKSGVKGIVRIVRLTQYVGLPGRMIARIFGEEIKKDKTGRYHLGEEKREEETGRFYLPQLRVSIPKALFHDIQDYYHMMQLLEHRSNEKDMSIEPYGYPDKYVHYMASGFTPPDMEERMPEYVSLHTYGSEPFGWPLDHIRKRQPLFAKTWDAVMEAGL